MRRLVRYELLIHVDARAIAIVTLRVEFEALDASHRSHLVVICTRVRVQADDVVAAVDELIEVGAVPAAIYATRVSLLNVSREFAQDSPVVKNASGIAHREQKLSSG